eukprot:29345-Pelagococcus_subviridis.AAC.1
MVLVRELVLFDVVLFAAPLPVSPSTTAASLSSMTATMSGLKTCVPSSHATRSLERNLPALNVFVSPTPSTPAHAVVGIGFPFDPRFAKLMTAGIQPCDGSVMISQRAVSAPIPTTAGGDGRRKYVIPREGPFSGCDCGGKRYEVTVVVNVATGSSLEPNDGSLPASPVAAVKDGAFGNASHSSLTDSSPPRQQVSYLTLILKLKAHTTAVIRPGIQPPPPPPQADNRLTSTVAPTASASARDGACGNPLRNSVAPSIALG